MERIKSIIVETINEALRAVDRYEETCDKVTWEPLKDGGYEVVGYVKK